MSDSKAQLEAYPGRLADQVLDQIVTQGIFRMSGDRFHPMNRVAGTLLDKIRATGAEQFASFQQSMCRAVERNIPVVIEVDQESHPEFWKVSPQRKPAQGSGSFLIVEDVTHHHFHQAQKADFIAGIAHEVRTPLTSLLMGIHLLKRDHASGTVPDRWLELCTQEGERLRGLVEQLLSSTRLSLLDPESFSGDKVPHSPSEIYSAALRCISGEAYVRKVNLLPLAVRSENHTHNPGVEYVPSMLGDPIRLGWAFEQALLRLIRSGHKGDRIASSLEVQELESGGANRIRLELRVGLQGAESLNTHLDWQAGVVLPPNDPDPAHFGITLAREVLNSMGAVLTWVRRPSGNEPHRTLEGFWICWNELGQMDSQAVLKLNQNMGNGTWQKF